MNTSNRPTIKVTEYELQWKASKKTYWKELNAENTDWSDIQNFPTGNTRIIERPMNDAEYIKYLEDDRNKMHSKLFMAQQLLVSKRMVEVDDFYSKTIGMQAQGRFLKTTEMVLNDNWKEIEYGQLSISQIIQKIERGLNG